MACGPSREKAFGCGDGSGAFREVPRDAVALRRCERSERSDRYGGLSYDVSFCGRATGYVDLIPWSMADLSAVDPSAARKLFKFGFGEGKVAEIWQFFPLHRAMELRRKGVGSAVLIRLMGELEREGFEGTFVLKPFTKRMRKLAERNGFLSAQFERDDCTRDTIMCRRFESARSPTPLGPLCLATERR